MLSGLAWAARRIGGQAGQSERKARTPPSVRLSGAGRSFAPLRMTLPDNLCIPPPSIWAAAAPLRLESSSVSLVTGVFQYHSAFGSSASQLRA